MTYSLHMSFYLGIDQSLTHSGVVILDAAGAHVASATIKPGKLRGAERLHFIQAELTKLALEHPLSGAACEGISHRSTGRVLDLAECLGVVRATLWRCTGAEPLVLPPTTLKKVATGNGGAQKELMLRMAGALGYDAGGDDNLADAYFLARCAWVAGGGKTPRRSEIEWRQGLQTGVKRKKRPATAPLSV